MVILDLTDSNELGIKLKATDNPDAEWIIEFEDLPNINGGHKIELSGEEYTIGNGLAVVGDSLLWTFKRTPFDEDLKKLTGYLESLTLTGGDYYKLPITIFIV